MNNYVVEERSASGGGTCRGQQGKYVDFLSPHEVYFREMNKSQNRNPISP